MKHKATLTISRPSYGDGCKAISIQVMDVDARVRFLELEIGYAEFAQVLTGLSEIECMMEVKDLQNVGKQIERKTIEFEMPKNKPYCKDTASTRAIQEAPEDWRPSLYFGSKSSFFSQNDVNYARTDIYRWVDKEQESE